MRNKAKEKNRTGTIMSIISAFLMLLLLCSPSFAAEGYDKVAKPGEMGKSVDVATYGMVPIYGSDVEDGKYEVQVRSSSNFFHVHEAFLTVKDGKMSAEITLSSVSYKYMFQGTAEEAASAEMEEFIAPKDKNGRSTFKFKVDALNEELPCAAFSKRKKKWYDRMLLFEASSLPVSAVRITVPDYDRIQEALDFYDEANGTDIGEEAKKEQEAAQAIEEMDEGTIVVEPVTIDKKDGEYSIQVTMAGGSGRASVTSPTWLIVKDGKAYARLLWSSTYYDYMIVGGKKYLNETLDGGNSTFTIPIAAMDEPMAVIADTTAMGNPVEIEYALTFYESSIGEKSQVPQEAAIYVLRIALIIIVAGGVLNLIVKRRRKQ